ncbi:MAG: hypothetical protein J2P17_06360, partial [Mycobacterium sp.]|nr:hypothetical protein [Mycobacterium sp.]
MIRQGPRYRHKIYEGQLCALLEVDAKGLDKLIRRHNFPHQADSDKNGAYWPVSAVRHWISTAQYRPLRSLLPVWWPDATEPATYRGAEPVRYRRNDLKPAAVLQHWRTSYGANIVVCWPMIGHTTTVVGGYLSEWAPEADAYVAIGTDFGLYGTDVWAKRGDWQGDSEDLAWADLARVLGQPAPFWPDSLRAPQLIQQWSPGAEPVAHHGESPLDTAPLLRMAALYPVGHPVHGAMMHTAQ